jgi:hypothetical protein
LIAIDSNKIEWFAMLKLKGAFMEKLAASPLRDDSYACLAAPGAGGFRSRQGL